ncbi:hypothetical protein [Bifidobacterium leontopitheci]|uniref:hypothetical protein n=1 Tax=Bifidobacterium leontopitheci TaxID=2650774 RepID=UPI0012642CA7|nr:hypothetical protein [Bifidobacterium leontopitheci]
MALVAGLAGCGSSGSRGDARGQGASEQEAIEYQLSGLGEKRAESMGEFIDSLIKDPATTEKAKGILERAKREGGMSATDYERSWADYKQCMLDRGYKEIILIKYPNGIYREAPLKVSGTNEQTARYVEDMRSCMSDLFPLIELYGAQVGNPNLYANKSEAIVDCLRRNGAVPMSYTVNDYAADKAKDDYTKAGIDVRDMKVRECEVANNWFSSYPGDTREAPW